MFFKLKMTDFVPGGALGVGCIMAQQSQWGDFAILSIFPEIDVDFCFDEEYFLPTIFFIDGQVGYARKISQSPCFIS